ncbi:LacI family DNA-binding transcriptional regulator [Clostridium pasteurianum]|uniref:Transcriptional regulator n=1 Tax=Clostridium pasteurianum BC1 TaxID=86416 RepID=R4K9C1_CLOPA|nr:LacI family DNA-binding transcriptional regulator [Clostridium pasteurianum]AGK99153.1 transcriptional regulator [Clostridium pasteurianum BC1]
MKENKITISHIADSLGVSSMSVSRALSGQAGVSDKLRNKVLEKAKELKYAKCKKASSISVLVLHQKALIDDNSNFSTRVQGIEKVLQQNDAQYDLEFVDKDKQNNMYLPYKLSKGTYYDGVILLGRFSLQYADFISNKINNLVFYTGYSPSYDYDSVWFNFNNSAYKQCKYLIDNNHKNIGYLGDMSRFRNKEMLMGITTCLEDYNIEVKNEFFINMKNNYRNEVIKLFSQKNRPTSIICGSDFIALELIKILHDIKINVPENVSIIGTGNTQISSLSIPSLTTADLNIEYSCEVVVDLLLKKISNPCKPKENISIYTSLVKRDSVRKI